MKNLLVGVHNGVFHADDVLCVVLVKKFIPDANIEVVRTRDPKVLANCDFVLDVGGEDKVTEHQVCFDHHQCDEFYDNGIKKAACGKLFEYIWNTYITDEIVPKELREEVKENLLLNIFYPVEAQDNGQQTSIVRSNKFSFISEFNPGFKYNTEEYAYESFMEVVEMAYNTFNRMFIKAIDKAEVSVEIREKLENNYNDEIFVLGSYVPWQSDVIKYNENQSYRNKIKIVIFENSQGEYMIQVVPTGNEEDSFESIIQLPDEWKGKRDEELSNIVGVDGAIFCHMGRFIAGFKSYKSAHNAAVKVLNSLDDNYQRDYKTITINM